MANVGLHSILGATRQGSSSTGRTSGGTSSSRSGSAPRSTTVNASTARAPEVTSTTGQRPANNVVSQNSNVSNYESFVVEVPTASGISRRVLISDGISTWPVVVGGARLPDYNRSLYNSVDKIDTGDYVVDQLHKFFSVYYRYGLLPGNDDGYGEKPPSKRSGPAGSYGKTTAEIEYEARKTQVDAIKYATATQQNKVVTLSDILKTADTTNHVFYVPVDYYYGGATINSAPRISQDAAVASAATQAATQAASDDDNNLMLYLGALGIIAVGYLVFKKKNKKKRK